MDGTRAVFFETEVFNTIWYVSIDSLKSTESGKPWFRYRYAFAIILWELATRKIPYQGVNAAVVQNCVKGGEREGAIERCRLRSLLSGRKKWVQEKLQLSRELWGSMRKNNAQEALSRLGRLLCQLNSQVSWFFARVSTSFTKLLHWDADIFLIWGSMTLQYR